MTFVSDGVESADKTFASFPFDKGVITDDAGLAFALAMETFSVAGMKLLFNVEVAIVMSITIEAGALLH